QLFELQTAKTPDYIAVEGIDALTNGHLYLSYRELNERANQLARYLHQENRLTVEERVGIFMDRSLSMMAALLSIIKAGGAYVPLSPVYPLERIKHIIDDSGTRVIISQTRYNDILNRLKRACQGLEMTLCTDSEDVQRQEEKGRSEVHVNPDTAKLGYIIYTSGSTGIPKGVMAEHRGVIRLVKNNPFVQLKPGDKILQTGALEFDASTF
ncbi:MAG: AMP-binding protein, partial [bacterium]|nr:AMP-binding protein [bacterium]